MTAAATHLVTLPILIPLLAGAIMLFFNERRRQLKAAIGVASALALVVVALAIMAVVDGQLSDGEAPIAVYLLGNWSSPFGIVLVADRLTAMMLLLSSILGLASLVYSLSRWHRAGAHFHSLMQFQLMGLNGAFLTGDLFNLFVFFEVMLAASYGLLLHGSGITRVKAGLHYIAINLAASLLFLIGVSLIYGVTGTLNMADLALKVPQVAEESRALLQAGAAILGIAFLIKAGMWPLGLWLAPTYAAAAAPVAALFAIMSKVGIYILFRLWLLLFGEEAGASEGFGGTWLLVGGMLTIVFGMIGVLASQRMERLAGYSLVVSTGTLLAALSFGTASLTGAALFYLVSSTLAISAFFLLIELVERGRAAGADVFAVTMEAFGDIEAEDFEEDGDVGVPIPATVAILGAGFVGCALLIAGMPPLSGFIAKFAMMHAIFNLEGFGGAAEMSTTKWVFVTLLILSGLAALIALTRSGINTFWVSMEETVPRVRVLEMAPVVALILICLVLMVQAGPVMRYMNATAEALHDPRDYKEDVLGRPVVPYGDGVR